MPWYVLCLLSAIFLSLSRIFEKKVLFSEHALEFSTATSIYRMIMLLLLIPIIDFSNISLQGLLFLYFVSVVGMMAFLYRSKATKHMSISEVEPLFNLQPIFLLILSFFFLGERQNMYQIIGILILIIGTYILEISSDSKSLLAPIKKFLNSKYIHYMLFTILAFAFTAMFDKIGMDVIVPGRPLTYAFIIFMFMGINFVLLDLYRFGTKDVILSLKTKPFMVIISMILHFINIIFYYTALALPGALVSLVIPIRRTSSLFTTIIGGNIFKESRILQKCFATLIMIIGASIIIIFT